MRSFTVYTIHQKINNNWSDQKGEEMGHVALMVETRYA
jgi:hypothetical protein